MARYERIPAPTDPITPHILLVPVLNNSGPQHWQSHWEAELPNASRAQLGCWENPDRSLWVNRLNLAIHKASAPVILVAHSLGCHAAAWWAEYEQASQHGGKVAGALLVAPPDVERAGVDARLARFGPLIQGRLPFRSLLVASLDDPYAAMGQSKRMARKWGSQLIDAGPLGHINADSGIGNWPYGKFLLRQLIRSTGGANEAATGDPIAAHQPRWAQSVMATR
jgi:predicted alpha/beta hydrolase family esterase